MTNNRNICQEEKTAVSHHSYGSNSLQIHYKPLKSIKQQRKCIVQNPCWFLFVCNKSKISAENKASSVMNNPSHPKNLGEKVSNLFLSQNIYCKTKMTYESKHTCAHLHMYLRDKTGKYIRFITCMFIITPSVVTTDVFDSYN